MFLVLAWVLDPYWVFPELALLFVNRLSTLSQSIAGLPGKRRVILNTELDDIAILVKLKVRLKQNALLVAQIKPSHIADNVVPVRRHIDIVKSKDCTLSRNIIRRELKLQA
jgi:hypothetical protein